MNSKIPENYKGSVFSIHKQEHACKKKCSVPHCTSKYGDTSFHRFPKEKELSKKWKIVCRFHENINVNLITVCGKHFKEQDFIRGNPRKPYLMKTAIPSKNLPVASFGRHVNVEQNERRNERAVKRLCLPQLTTSQKYQEISEMSSVDASCSEPSTSFVDRDISSEHALSDLNASTRKEHLSSVEANCSKPSTSFVDQEISKQHAESDPDSSNRNKYLREMGNGKSPVSFVEQVECPKCGVSSPHTVTISIEQALLLGITVPKQVTETGIQVNTLQDLPKFSVMDLVTTETKLNSWTGIPTFALLHSIEESTCQSFPDENHGKSGLTMLERILLVFVKMKTNLTFACMTSIFDKTNSTISRNFASTLPLIRVVMEDIVYFPSAEENKANLPKSFRKYGYAFVRAILDCSEVKIQLPHCINCRISTFSQYKATHTLKFMICITPGGMISFISKPYSGKSSDKFIFNKENLIAKFDAHKDAIMVDKGVLIENELLSRNIALVRPTFYRSEQFEEFEQISNTKIAALRVHVERAIQRVKIFSIVTNVVEYNILPHMEDALIVIGSIANLTKPILAVDKF